MSAWQHDLDLLAALDAGVPLKVVARSSVDQEAVMAKSTIVGSPLLSSALAGAAALALFSGSVRNIVCERSVGNLKQETHDAYQARTS
jgi:hypothetical protein